ncbi:hypothetical protein EGW08_022908 [Elysia chlorotica]|uniref:Potassium channel tetramerisation-type BTB domain-containing protein n=1 Tax=Elysia chlorotica TaxID=188477 RepID=A0A3S1B123_ELYCH|nr:hypothetical protein EGW08_022908 [Elysia chlorotica]
MDHLYVAINVGGQKFHIRLASLRSVPRTLLTELIDASLPLDLVFGGRAISEDDDHSAPGRKLVDRDDAVKTDMGYGSSGISTNGAKVTPSHPYDRAKYVYLSRSNTFRPIRTIQEPLSPPHQLTHHTSPARSPVVSSSSTTTTPHTDQTSTPATRLFIPATSLTSPRHRSVVIPIHKSRSRVEGFSNKGFHADDDQTEQTRLPNNIHANDLIAGKVDGHHDGQVEVHPAYTDLEPDGQSRDGTTTDRHIEVPASSLVRLPQAGDADIYVDRDPSLFPFVLDLYRNGQLHLPPDMCSLTIRMELDFWKIPEELIGLWVTLGQDRVPTKPAKQTKLIS